MGHCVQAIIAPLSTADAISAFWPELPRLDRANGFSIFPVEAEPIDARIAPDKSPAATDHQFMQLTGAFRDHLRAISRDGQLAYVETDYFGGVGGQGALVCRRGDEIMPPTWRKFGAINEALRLIGVKRPWIGDRFRAVGLSDVRSNGDILDLIAAESPNDGK